MQRPGHLRSNVSAMLDFGGGCLLMYVYVTYLLFLELAGFGLPMNKDVMYSSHGATVVLYQ